MNREIEHYRSLLDNFHGVLFRLDAELRLCAVFGAVEEYFGLSAEELLDGRTFWRNLIHPDDLPDFEEQARRVLAGEDRTLEADADSVEFRINRPGGPTLWVEQRLVLVVGEERELQGDLFDVTERKRFESLLLDSERRFEEFVKNAPIGIYRTTPSGRILMANPALLSMLGYDSWTDLSHRDLDKDGFTEDHTRQSFVESIERHGSVRAAECTWVARDGKLVHVIESARIVRNAQGRVLYYEGTVEDVTDRVESSKR